MTEHLPDVAVKFRPSRTPRSTEDDLAATTPLPRVKELNDATAAALLASVSRLVNGKECPKCGSAVRPRATACGRCGLVEARMATFTAERDEAAPDVIRRAWDRVIARWDDADAHDALFELIAQRGEYGWAAGRYRAQARERSDDPIARRHMKRIRRAIEATMVISATAHEKPRPSPYRNALAMLVVLLAVMAIGAIYMFVKTPTSAPANSPALSAPRLPSAR